MLALEKPLFSQPSSAGISKYHVRTIIIENLKFVPVLSCPENFPRVSQQSFLDHLHISFEFFAFPITNTTPNNFSKHQFSLHCFGTTYGSQGPGREKS